MGGGGVIPAPIVWPPMDLINKVFMDLLEQILEWSDTLIEDME
jgi:hypothetical protein